MTRIDLGDLGGRVARLRKMNDWSGDHLAALTGNGVSRSVLANIETGRKKDVSIVQAVALARALQVPLAALLFDLWEPTKPTTIPAALDSSSTEVMAVLEATEWLAGNTFGEPFTEVMPSSTALLLLHAYRAYSRAFADLRTTVAEVEGLALLEQAGRLSAQDAAWKAHLEGGVGKKESTLKRIEDDIRAFGVDVEPLRKHLESTIGQPADEIVRNDPSWPAARLTWPGA